MDDVEEGKKRYMQGNKKKDLSGYNKKLTLIIVHVLQLYAQK